MFAMILVIVLSAIAACAVRAAIVLYADNRRLAAAKAQLRADLDARSDADATLDYVLRYYSLHVPDPYLERPGFPEKRCHHCHYPLLEGHATDCIWCVVRPHVSALYP
jgi:hypothetical protein